MKILGLILVVVCGIWLAFVFPWLIIIGLIIVGLALIVHE